ncbi:hypothetical protein [Lacipirellula sp.]|uniref:hypothetical protein n=1 Tax=Lacipirellula sp. TaxID=2691419 RepID=UPI003D10F364
MDARIAIAALDGTHDALAALGARLEREKTGSYLAGAVIKLLDRRRRPTRRSYDSSFGEQVRQGNQISQKNLYEQIDVT